jgi:beta-lactamase regulating signal transducer with metallopeptidase domain
MNVELLRLLANHMWQSTLFAVAAALLTLALRKNRARIRHGVWLAASAKFLIPLSVLTLAGEHIPVHTPSKEEYVVLAAAREISEPFEPRATATNAAPAPPESSELFPALLFDAWISGVVCLSYPWITGWLRIRAAVRAGTAVDLGLTIRTVASPAATAPGVFGIFSPTLLLPESIVKHMAPAQLTAVVTHELCHVRNLDNLAAAFQMSVETIFWFHPLVWWIGKRMIAEREFACDEKVLLMGTEPKAYAEGILKIAKLYLESPLPCISGVTGANLGKRIEKIVANRIGIRMGFARKAVLIAVGSTTVAARRFRWES